MTPEPLFWPAFYPMAININICLYDRLHSKKNYENKILIKNVPELPLNITALS